jgi:hypothetical protein
VRRFVVAVAVAISLAAPAHAATTIAVLPSAGPAGAEARRGLDAALRKAVVADGEFDVLSVAETADHVATMAEFGAVCAASDTACLQKLGILASVDLLLVPEARGKRALEVKVTLLDVGDGKVVRGATGNLVPSDAADVEALVQRALHGSGAGEEHDGARTSTSTPPRALEVADGVDETELKGMQLAGAVTAGVGGGLGVVALLGALTGEALLAAGTGPKELRRTVLPLAQVLWVVTVTGAAAAGVGAGLFVAGAPADPRSLGE